MMGTLKDMIDFLEDTHLVMQSIAGKLGKLQENFNRNYNNVISVRNAEIEFLQEEFFNAPESFPREIRELFDKNLEVQKNIFEKNFTALVKKRDNLREEIELINLQKIFPGSLKSQTPPLTRKRRGLKSGLRRLRKMLKLTINGLTR